MIRVVVRLLAMLVALVALVAFVGNEGCAAAGTPRPQASPVLWTSERWGTCVGLEASWQGAVGSTHACLLRARAREGDAGQ